MGVPRLQVQDRGCWQQEIFGRIVPRLQDGGFEYHNQSSTRDLGNFTWDPCIMHVAEQNFMSGGNYWEATI